jgi:hypothetical protein
VFEEAVEQLLRECPSLDALLGLLGAVSQQPREQTETEVKRHVATRIVFLLLSEIDGSPNYLVTRRRLDGRLAGHCRDTDELVRALVVLSGHVDSLSVRWRSGLEDLTYVTRRALFQSQGYRCGVCGWEFGRVDLEQRTEKQSTPALDHRVPFALGGDRLSNLWILCGLCNSVKQNRLHVGEHGPVWTGNYVYWFRRKTVAFWAMFRDRRCQQGNCSIPPAEGRMHVVRRENRGGWALDNCLTVCSSHVGQHDAIQY